MKKKLISNLLLCAVVSLSISACGNTINGNSVSGSAAANTQNIHTDGEAVNPLPYVLNTMEYTLYQNIYFNNQGSDYVNKDVTKKGVFTTIVDKYNNTTRYYVWGYNDETKCCDWQWELHLTDTSDLPANGTQVEVRGTFVADDASLDGYWIETPKLTVTEAYEGPACDLNMATMSATLERVQILNIQYKPEDFEGMTVYAYGRTSGTNQIQHPYYDDMWTMEYKSDNIPPATGTVSLISGTIQKGILSDASISGTSLF